MRYDTLGTMGFGPPVEPPKPMGGLSKAASVSRKPQADQIGLMAGGAAPADWVRTFPSPQQPGMFDRMGDALGALAHRAQPFAQGLHSAFGAGMDALKTAQPYMQRFGQALGAGAGAADRYMYGAPPPTRPYSMPGASVDPYGYTEEQLAEILRLAETDPSYLDSRISGGDRWR